MFQKLSGSESASHISEKVTPRDTNKSLRILKNFKLKIEKIIIINY